METLFEGAERLLGIFGRWPSFHDAEVLSLAFDREGSSRGVDVTVEIHVWETTNEVDERGYYKHVHSTRATLRFMDCDEINLREFNYQNVIFGLTGERDDQHRYPILIGFEPCFGLYGALRCRHAEVVEAVPMAPQV